jgi:hypothetical protein
MDLSRAVARRRDLLLRDRERLDSELPDGVFRLDLAEDFGINARTRVGMLA